MNSECEHYSYECNYGWHTCADCKTSLGTSSLTYEPHNWAECSICGPEVLHEGTPCVLPHPCPQKSYAHKVSRKPKVQEDVSPVQDEMDVPYGRPPKFETKDSGKREEYSSGMVRDTQESKPRFDLLLVDGLPFDEQFLTRFAALLERGAAKYGERNWQKANSKEELLRFRASGLRHMHQWMCGETDEDHAVAVAFNLMAAEYVKWKLEQNEDPTL